MKKNGGGKVTTKLNRGHNTLKEKGGVESLTSSSMGNVRCHKKQTVFFGREGKKEQGKSPLKGGEPRTRWDKGS